MKKDVVKRKVRNIIEMFEDLDETARNEVKDTINNDEIMRIARQVGKTKTVAFGTIRPEVEYRQQFFNKFEGYGVGLRYFDDATMGFRPGEVTVIAAPSNFGKTMVGLNIIAALASNVLKKALIISMEMTPSEIGSRLYNMVDNPDALNESVYIQTDLAVSSEHVDAMVGKHQPDLLFIDHLQFLAKQERGQEYERISQAIANVKRIAINRNIPIIIISHVAKTRSGINGEATVQDLKGSSSIEQDADIVFMINRHDEYPDSVLITLAKHRTKRPAVFNKMCILEMKGIRIGNDGKYSLFD